MTNSTPIRVFQVATGNVGLPLVEIDSMRQLQRLYREWDLAR